MKKPETKVTEADVDRWYMWVREYGVTKALELQKEVNKQKKLFKKRMEKI